MQPDMSGTNDSEMSALSSGMNETAGEGGDIPEMIQSGQLVKSERNMYRVMKSIGQGQHSICYVAQDMHTQLEYCLKVRGPTGASLWSSAVRWRLPCQVSANLGQPAEL